MLPLSWAPAEADQEAACPVRSNAGINSTTKAYRRLNTVNELGETECGEGNRNGL